MSFQIPEPEAIPTNGAQVGRHLIVREVAKGTFWALHLAHTPCTDQERGGIGNKLVSVIPLPGDLPERDYQSIIEAIRDNTDVVHDMALEVVDVVSAKESVALVHDLVAGSSLHSFCQRGGDAGCSFSPDIAVRIALDIVEGIEQSIELYAAKGRAWRSGGIAMDSLYLCCDGRTRTLDAPVLAAVQRLPRMRALGDHSLAIAPEILDDSREPDERTDVFAIGAVLVDLIAGHEMSTGSTAPVGSAIPVVPAGLPVNERLVRALRRAIALDPSKRQSTLQSLVVDLVTSVEKVATHAQVAQSVASFSPRVASCQADLATASGDGSALDGVVRLSNDQTPPPLDDKMAQPEVGIPHPAAGVATNAIPATVKRTQRYPSPFDPRVVATVQAATLNSAPASTVEASPSAMLGHARQVRWANTARPTQDLESAVSKRQFARKVSKVTLFLGLSTATLAIAVVTVTMRDCSKPTTSVALLSARPAVDAAAAPALKDACAAATEQGPAERTLGNPPAAAKTAITRASNPLDARVDRHRRRTSAIERAATKASASDRSTARAALNSRQAPGPHVPEDP